MPELITQQRADIYRYNGDLTSTPHSIDFGPTDLGLHLHEHHLESPATLAIFDGVTRGMGGDSGLFGPITLLSLGRDARRGGGRHASVDMFEVVIVDQAGLDQAANYRDMRIREEYPTIPLPEPSSTASFVAALLSLRALRDRAFKLRFGSTSE